MRDFGHPRAGQGRARRRQRRGRHGGRPLAIDPEKIEAITVALDAGASKAAVCRTFGLPRSTLIDTLKRIGWTLPTVIGAVRGNRSIEV